MNTDALTYKLSAYEGPIDLLYKLIQLNKLDIFDIPIAELAAQYMNFLEKADRRDMDSMSEFTLLAATLLEIKSKMLLPRAVDEPEEDPRKQLVDAILEYRRAKFAAELFVSLEEQNDGCFFKPPQKELIDSLKPKETLDETLEGVTLAELFRVFKDVMSRREKRTDKIRSTFNSVRKEKFTVEMKSLHILALLKSAGTVFFNRLLARCAGKREKIVTFLAVLELVKAKEIDAYQENAFGEIEIRKCV